MLVLSSSAFEGGQEIPQKHGKKIANVSPQLSWKGAPGGVVDIGADVTSLPEAAAGAAMPAGSREVKPYAGPFPPSGAHDYEFTLYALETDRLDLPRKASLEAFTRAAEPNALATARLVGKFTKVRTRSPR
jgi:phosphatidylethanolamine-binding protein (PEBP) family uncharacterized protein